MIPIIFVCEGQKVHKRALTKLFNENKISADRLKWIIDANAKNSTIEQRNNDNDFRITCREVVRLANSESYWMIIIRIIQSVNNVYWDVVKILLTEITKETKIYGSLLKLNNIAKYLHYFDSKKMYKVLNDEKIFRKTNYQIENDLILIANHFEQALGKGKI